MRYNLRATTKKATQISIQNAQERDRRTQERRKKLAEKKPKMRPVKRRLDFTFDPILEDIPKLFETFNYGPSFQHDIEDLHACVSPAVAELISTEADREPIQSHFSFVESSDESFHSAETSLGFTDSETDSETLKMTINYCLTQIDEQLDEQLQADDTTLQGQFSFQSLNSTVDKVKLPQLPRRSPPKSLSELFARSFSKFLK